MTDMNEYLEVLEYLCRKVNPHITHIRFNWIGEPTLLDCNATSVTLYYDGMLEEKCVSIYGESFLDMVLIVIHEATLPTIEYKGETQWRNGSVTDAEEKSMTVNIPSLKEKAFIDALYAEASRLQRSSKNLTENTMEKEKKNEL